MVPANYKYLSPGLYRSPTGAIVRQSQIPQNTTAPAATNKPATTAPTTQSTTQAAPTAPAYSTTFKQNDKGYYVGANNQLISKARMDSFLQRYGQAASRFKTLKPTSAGYNRYGAQIQDIGKRFGIDTTSVLGKNWKPYQAPQAAPVAPPPQPGQSPMTSALMKAMASGMNTMQAYEPRNYEGSPLYKFQKQQGLQDLEKLMAARGLTNSGAEVQANSNFLSELNANEAEKARQYADQAAQRQQNAMQFIANFDQGQKEFDASRQDRRGELMTGFLTNILNMQNDNNIAALSQGGLNSQTALSQQLAGALRQQMGDNYKRYGSGGGAPPTAPGNSDAAIMEALMKYGDGAGDNDVIDSILRQFT